MPVSDEAFERVVALTRAKADGAGEEVGDEPRLEVGDDVQVLEGPFKGMLGPVLELNPAEKVVTLALSVMGRDTPVELPEGHCAKAAGGGGGGGGGGGEPSTSVATSMEG